MIIETKAAADDDDDDEIRYFYSNLGVLYTYIVYANVCVQSMT